MKPEIRIYRQNRRNLMMRPTVGAVEVYIPYQLSEDDTFVQEFIAQGIAKLGDNIPEIPLDLTSRKVIKAMVKDYAQRLNVQASRVQFRDMRRKWGSCSSKGTVTLNARLTWLPPELVEYIVCHELAHLIELNHSKKFWKLVEQHMPDYEARLAELRQLETTLHW